MLRPALTWYQGRTSLERDVRSKLHHAAAADGPRDVTEIGVPQNGAGVAELRRIGQAEGLAAQLQTQPFRQLDALEEREVEVKQPRPADRISTHAAEGESRRRSEARLREPGTIETDAMQDLERRHQVGRL